MMRILCTTKIKAFSSYPAKNYGWFYKASKNVSPYSVENGSFGFHYSSNSLKSERSSLPSGISNVDITKGANNNKSKKAQDTITRSDEILCASLPQTLNSKTFLTFFTSNNSIDKVLKSNSNRLNWRSYKENLHRLAEASKDFSFNKLNDFREGSTKMKSLLKSKVCELSNSSLRNSLKVPAFIKHAGKTLNDATGYSEIEKLKNDIELKAQEFQEAKQRLRDSKEQYRACIETRAKGQRDINNLLQRKHSWQNEDVDLFTKLYRDEHLNEQIEQKAKAETKQWEDLVELRYDQLVAAIRTKYYEEQLWSDKIRGASTYWTLALILLNTLMFLSVHTIFEPRKRSKLIEKVQENLSSSWEEGTHQIKGLITALDDKLGQQDTQTQEIIQRLNHFEAYFPKAKGSQEPSDVSLNMITSRLGDTLNSILSTTSLNPEQGTQTLPQPSLGYSDLRLGLLAFTCAAFGVLSAGLVLGFSR